jgi:hypothetical protein
MSNLEKYPEILCLVCDGLITLAIFLGPVQYACLGSYLPDVPEEVETVN